MLTYSISETEGIRMISLSGTLTVTTVPILQSAVRNFIDHESILVNAENVTLITTGGLNALIELSLQAKNLGTRVIILWPGRDLLEMAERLMVYNYLIFAHTLEEARMKVEYFK